MNPGIQAFRHQPSNLKDRRRFRLYGYRVYCGEACNGKYGISGCGPDDFVVVSYGRDGKEEDWLYDFNNPKAGLYEVVSLDDFDKDIVMWNGSWIRAPRLRR